MDKRQLTCINCPMGCQLLVEIEGDQLVKVSGNACKLGESYAAKEITNPTRIVTTTVKVVGGDRPLVSVKTKTDIPKGKIYECVNALSQVQVKAPIQIGDIILKNVADTGVDIVATIHVSAKV